jgi:hypothetical protein
MSSERSECEGATSEASAKEQRAKQVRRSNERSECEGVALLRRTRAASLGDLEGQRAKRVRRSCSSAAEAGCFARGFGGATSEASAKEVHFCGGSGLARGLSGGDPPNPPPRPATCSVAHVLGCTRARSLAQPPPHPPAPLTPMLCASLAGTRVPPCLAGARRCRATLRRSSRRFPGRRVAPRRARLSQMPPEASAQGSDSG